MPEGIPPGRAGRVWLRDRLAAGRRSLELLDRKRQLLTAELAALEPERDRLANRWREAYEEAERWGVRANALRGALDVALATVPVAGLARAEIPWRSTMGVVHPDTPSCALPHLPEEEAAAANAAVSPAAAAARGAIEAAVAHAAAERAQELLREELVATERRRRALEHHRLPALEDALTRLELRLDELEREEQVVRRWAQRRQQRTSSTTRAPGTGPEVGHRPRTADR